MQGFIKDIDEKKQIPVDPTAAALSYVTCLPCGKRLII